MFLLQLCFHGIKPKIRDKSTILSNKKWQRRKKYIFIAIFLVLEENNILWLRKV